MERNTSVKTFLLLLVIMQASICQQSGQIKRDAVALGYPVTFSSVRTHNGWDHGNNYVLDSCDGGHQVSCAWCAHNPIVGEWAKVSTFSPRLWTDIILQGRQDWNGWVKTFHLEFSEDGINWVKYKYGISFQGNHDRNTRQLLTLDPPIRARSVKIVADSFNGLVCMRFAALYLEEESC